jgi:hypothetical protein
VIDLLLLIAQTQDQPDEPGNGGGWGILFIVMLFVFLYSAFDNRKK